MVVIAEKVWTGVTAGNMPGAIAAIFKFCWYCNANRCCAMKLNPADGLTCGDTTGGTRIDDGSVDSDRGVDGVGARKLRGSCGVGGVGDVVRRRFVVVGPSEEDSVLDGDGTVDVGFESQSLGWDGVVSVAVAEEAVAESGEEWSENWKQ